MIKSAEAVSTQPLLTANHPDYLTRRHPPLPPSNIPPPQYESGQNSPVDGQPVRNDEPHAHREAGQVLLERQQKYCEWLQKLMDEEW